MDSGWWYGVVGHVETPVERRTGGGLQRYRKDRTVSKGVQQGVVVAICS